MPYVIVYGGVNSKVIMSMLSPSQPMPEQPEILLQLRQKAADLRSTQQSLREQNKQLSGGVAQASDQLNVLLREREVQERKGKSLVLLVTDIQRQIDHFFSSVPNDDQEETLVAQNRILRELLVKVAQRAQEDQKLVSFLRQAAASGAKAQDFLQRSKYLEGQTELLSKLRSQMASFSNPNMECSRKWSELDRQGRRLQREEGFLRIQAQRVKTELREHYEEYLEALNRSKASLVNFNETQRERVITQHLVEEVARLQENRLGVQQLAKNLKHHQETLLEENARIQMENRELKSFFTAPNAEEEHRLATRMRARVEELRDSLIEVQKQNAMPQLPVGHLADSIRGRLKSLEETAAYIEKKIREEQQGKVSLEEKDIVTFFEGILRGRDQRLHISRERQAASNQRLRELKVRRQLLANQIINLEEGMRYHHYENTSFKLSQTTQKQSNQPTNVGERWGQRMNVTNLLTTTSKFVPN